MIKTEAIGNVSIRSTPDGGSVSTLIFIGKGDDFYISICLDPAVGEDVVAKLAPKEAMILGQRLISLGSAARKCNDLNNGAAPVING